MDILQETVAVYERLRKKRYRIIVDTGEDFTFTFQPANYHHLAGFQHLTDFRNISSPKIKDRFYGSVKRQQLQTEYIQRSSSYHEIEERLHTAIWKIFLRKAKKRSLSSMTEASCLQRSKQSIIFISGSVACLREMLSTISCSLAAWMNAFSRQPTL